MMQPVKRALILAAGRGKRLMPFTHDKPKCLVKVTSHPILYYQLNALIKYGITHVTVVTGYLGNTIVTYTAKAFPELIFRFIHNPQYENTNDIYSLYLAREELGTPMLIMDSDVLFHPSILHVLLSSQYENAVCFRRVLCGDEEMKVEIDSDSRIRRITKLIMPEVAQGEYIGISLLRESFSRSLVDSLDHFITQGIRSVYREVAFERVIQEQKIPLYAIDVTKYPAIEIDFPADLQYAEREIIPRIISHFS